MGAIWPSKDTSDDTYAEWARFIRPFEFKTAQRALDSLASTSKWRPSMAEFREAYNLALSNPSQRQLGNGTQQTLDYSDTFGSEQADWCYCYLCDMAITLEERATEPHYTDGKGLRHKSCPKRGSAPTMPPWLKLKREEQARTR
jgi:hypothetical protein